MEEVEITPEEVRAFFNKIPKNENLAVIMDVTGSMSPYTAQVLLWHKLYFDENKKQLFWQAISESSFNPKATPEKREARLNAIVEKVMSSYPPEK